MKIKKICLKKKKKGQKLLIYWIDVARTYGSEICCNGNADCCCDVLKVNS